jgi:hypothetical protein
VTPALNETDLLHLLLVRAPLALPDVRLFRRNVLNVATDKGFRARNGIKGQADAYALVRGGLHVELETKAARGRLEERQVAWREFCHEWRVPHLVLRARAREEPNETVARWIEEIRTIVEVANG